ncbi:Nucleotidyl transferase AbiEii toxin, Type IV TA system [Chryseobacterium rhizoplanae]|uniref:Nucleotidyl transferase AbiEii toxin, Type IV TA system n=1 Tax=Chryseobacterium rhizoplanae TaxID=1609531 RepID=A0A521CWJ3_9FLAO|nr:nucleotidyl transferase AbiEii/AbiGii toxin family protein [Chryseobacterium rhizoplanae]SMO63111.1 Nucleotidyl transferase AbiEii toxin, Type IV TA system [Chryseobacterium rhizoplanae]
MLHKETVSKEMWELLQKLMKEERLKDFTLVGGTALSLMLGHRLSIDIDLFTTKPFNEKSILNYLSDNYPVEVKNTFENTLLLKISEIKVDILAHQYQWQLPTIITKEDIRLASLEDIGAMKLHAIFQDGSRIKDFVDIHFLLEHNSLRTYLDFYQKKYGGNPSIAALSLLYHDNIDRNVQVKMIKGKDITWQKVEERLKKSVQNPLLKFTEIKEQNHKQKGQGFKR